MKTIGFRRTAAACLAALATAGLLAGCSSSKSPKTVSSSTTGSSTTSSAASAGSSSASQSPAPSTTQASPGPVAAGGGGAFCQQAASIIKAANLQAAASANASLQDIVKRDQAVEAQLKQAAPSQIKPDLEVIFQALDGVFAALANNNYDITKLDPSVLAPFDSANFKAAEARIDQYAKTACGVDLGGSPVASS